MILGFIGTGKISSSIIFGIFKSKLKIKRIYISSRNRNIAKKLSKSNGKIKVLNNNQEIIDKSSVVFLGVTPNVGNKILLKLKFSKNKKIISLISTINLDKLKNSKPAPGFDKVMYAGLPEHEEEKERNQKGNIPIILELEYNHP